MNKNIYQKSHKWFILAPTIFFVGFGLMGLLDADFFEKNMFLTIIGALIGIVLMLSMFIYSISMLPSIKPFKTITNFIKISHIFIFVFLINYVLPDDTTLIERFEIRWVIFIVLGVYVIISNIFMVINEKSNDKTILHMKWEKAIQKIEVPSINAYEAKLIFYIGIAAILILSFIDINLRIASNYSVLIVINIFIIVRYIAIFKTSKKINYIIIFTSLSLTIISVSLFIAFTDFINSQSLLKIILTMLPSLYLYPKIIKSYYPFLWKEIYEINIKQ